MAEALARDLAQRAGTPIATASAGVRATDGVEATDRSIRALRRLGIDLTAHRSRLLTVEHLAAADLVLCMEREHLLAVHDLGCPFDRTFTVPELAGIAARIGRGGFAGWDDFRAATNEGRTPATALAAPEVDDPTGRSGRHHRATADRLSGDLATIVAVLPR